MSKLNKLLTSVWLPEGVDDAKVRGELLRRFDIEVGGGLGDLAGKGWRIAGETLLDSTPLPHAVDLPAGPDDSRPGDRLLVERNRYTDDEQGICHEVSSFTVRVVRGSPKARARVSAAAIEAQAERSSTERVCIAKSP